MKSQAPTFSPVAAFTVSQPGVQPKARQHDMWATVLFAAFVFATCTGLNPLAERRALTSYLDTGSGDLVRQLVYLGLLGGGTLLARGRFMRNVPPPVLVLFGWFAVTLLWSPVPDIAARRLGLTIVIAATAFMLADNLPMERLIRDLRWTLLFMLMASLVAAILLPTRTFHQFDDPESSVVGSFRGVFYHKNILGGVAAISGLLSLYALRTERKKALINWAMLAVSLLCLALSQSKTSIGLGFLAIILYLVWAKYKNVRHLFWLVPIAALLVAGALSVDIAELLTDPEAFTGRGMIWRMTFDIFLSNPIGGLGYQSVFQTGSASAFAQLGTSRFLSTLSHAHNSYLEVAASTGIVGLALLCWIIPKQTLAVFPVMRLPRELEALLTSVIIFIILHSFTESGLTDRDRPIWVVLLLIIGSSYARMRSLRRSGRQSLGAPRPVAPLRKRRRAAMSATGR